MINWSKLYNEGRVKAIGIPWNSEEQNAIHNLKIPFEYVRDGVTTLEKYTKVLEKECVDGKPVERWVISELRTKASQLGISFTPDATEETLITAIKKELKNTEEAEKQSKIVQETSEKVAAEEAETRANIQLATEKAKANIIPDETANAERPKKPGRPAKERL